LDAAGIYNANSEVSNLLGGVDILKTELLDITDDDMVKGGSAVEIIYAAFSSAIATLADTSEGNLDVDGVLAVLSNSFIGGTIIADDDGMDDSIISLQEIIDGTRSVLGKKGIAVETSGRITELQIRVDEAIATGSSIDPKPSPIPVTLHWPELKLL